MTAYAILTVAGSACVMVTSLALIAASAGRLPYRAGQWLLPGLPAGFCLFAVAGTGDHALDAELWLGALALAAVPRLRWQMTRKDDDGKDE